MPPTSTNGNPYDPTAIRSSLDSGRLRPGSLWLVLFLRSFFCLAAQSVAALIFKLQGSPSPWAASVPYFYLFGTLADLGCLAVLSVVLKREGYRWVDLIRWPKKPAWRDVLVGFGLFLVLLPTTIIGVSLLANLLVYGTLQPDIMKTLFAQVPWWANAYSLVVWWLIWSPTESSFYNGFLFPRFEALTKKTWAAASIVGFAWVLHHVFFPLVLDWKYVAWRFLQFLVVGMVFPWLFARLRRLPPLIVTHWLLDFTGALMRILAY